MGSAWGMRGREIGNRGAVEWPVGVTVRLKSGRLSGLIFIWLLTLHGDAKRPKSRAGLASQPTTNVGKACGIPLGRPATHLPPPTDVPHFFGQQIAIAALALPTKLD